MPASSPRPFHPGTPCRQIQAEFMDYCRRFCTAYWAERDSCYTIITQGGMCRHTLDSVAEDYSRKKREAQPRAQEPGRRRKGE